MVDSAAMMELPKQHIAEPAPCRWRWVPSASSVILKSRFDQRSTRSLVKLFPLVTSYNHKDKRHTVKVMNMDAGNVGIKAKNVDLVYVAAENLLAGPESCLPKVQIFFPQLRPP